MFISVEPMLGIGIDTNIVTALPEPNRIECFAKGHKTRQRQTLETIT
jgi:hypothetical protein